MGDVGTSSIAIAVGEVDTTGLSCAELVVIVIDIVVVVVAVDSVCPADAVDAGRDVCLGGLRIDDERCCLLKFAGLSSMERYGETASVVAGSLVGDESEAMFVVLNFLCWLIWIVVV